MNRTSEQNGVVAVPPAEHVLDALADPVSVLDQYGTIIAVNQAWRDFGRANGGNEQGTSEQTTSTYATAPLG